jgi:general secretion pathway protein K
VSLSFRDHPGDLQQRLSCARQSGATLVVALVVVLLVVMLATRVTGDYLVLFRTIENQNSLQQARAYLRGAEAVAREALLQDVQLGAEIDSLREIWSQRLLIPLPEGNMDACLVDLQGRLNLNDLGASESEGYSAAQKRFIRLLQVLDVEPQLDQARAVELANAVFDWIDADSSLRYPGGAEELDYLQQQPSYKPANQAFASTTELLLIKGMTVELVAALTPHVSVWGNGNMNVNTLDAGFTGSDQPGTLRVNNADPEFPESPQPTLLRTLNNADSLLPLSIEGANLLANIRSGNGGFVPNLEFFGSGVLASQEWDLEGLDVKSEHFLLTADMLVQTLHYQLQTVLQRRVDAAGVPLVSVRSRQFGTAVFDMDETCAAALR